MTAPRTRAILARVAERFVAVARRAHRDEEGGSMVFGAMTLFTLVLFTYLVYIVGMTSGDRMQLQGAADAAAYSGALVEAESLESIGFLNDGMGYVYYAACRYAIDSVVYGTLGCFYYHDMYVQQKGSVQDVSDGPWMNLEMGAAAGINGGTRGNPDVYGNSTNQNYLPPAPDGLSFQVLDYSWALLGDGAGPLFENRFKKAMDHAQSLLGGKTPAAKLWLQDINYAERMIIATTPALVEETCVLVARQNGAAWVGISNDTDRVWRIYDPNDNDASFAGFQDGHETQTNGVSDALARRYASMQNPIDGAVRDYPSWFDATTGTPDGSYKQTRICWNKRDWQHEHDPGQNTLSHSSVDDPTISQMSGTPAAHWHARHAHNVDQLDPQSGDWQLIGPVLGADGSHDYGHGIQDGDDSQNHQPPDPQAPDPANFKIDDMDLNASPSNEHHAAQHCATCYSGAPSDDISRTPQGNVYSAVTHTQADAEWLFQNLFQSSGGQANDSQNWDRVTFDSSGGMGSPQLTVPRLVMARSQIFRAGVTVAAWMPCESLGSIYPGTSFGLLAVASAQVGLRTPDSSGRTTGTISVADTINNQTIGFSTGSGTFDLSEQQAGSSSQPMNLYLGEWSPSSGADTTNPGVRWGARLVPINRALTWLNDPQSDPSGSQAASNGLSNLLASGGRWYSNPDTPLNSNERSQLGTILQNLAKSFDPTQPNAVQALVH
jgi:hypothetical protein